MMKFDHLRIPVSDLSRSRAWYVATLGLKVEFAVPDRQTVALQDGDGFTIFPVNVPGRNRFEKTSENEYNGKVPGGPAKSIQLNLR